MKGLIAVCAMLLCAVPVYGAEGGAEGGAVATVTAVEGDVQIGRDTEWKPAAAGDRLEEGTTLKTGTKSKADIAFEEDLKVVVGADTTIKVSDLLLKARLERMKGKISKPTDSQKVGIQVTPTTGVRGTEQGEEKAEDLKRDHYWNENTPPAE